MRVSFTDDSRADLRDIGDVIALDSPRRADSFIREIVASAQQIGHLPRGYEVIFDQGEDSIRRKVFGAYLIFYRVAEDGVVILRILHGARDYERILSRGRP